MVARDPQLVRTNFCKQCLKKRTIKEVGTLSVMMYSYVVLTTRYLIAKFDCAASCGHTNEEGCGWRDELAKR